jgi:integrase
VLVRPRRIAEPDEIDRAAAHLSDWYKAIPYVAAYGGLRPSEVFALTLEGTNWLRREIHLEFGLTETSKLHVSMLNAKATIVLPEWVMLILAEHVRKYPPKPITLPLQDGKTITRRLLFTTLRGHPIRSKRFVRRYLEASTQEGGPAL